MSWVYPHTTRQYIHEKVFIYFKRKQNLIYHLKSCWCTMDTDESPSNHTEFLPSARRAERVAKLDENKWFLRLSIINDTQILIFLLKTGCGSRTNWKNQLSNLLRIWVLASCKLHIHRCFVRLKLTTLSSSEYNPPKFIIDAHKKALELVEYNQYGPQSVPSNLLSRIENQVGRN